MALTAPLTLTLKLSLIGQLTIDIPNEDGWESGGGDADWSQWELLVLVAGSAASVPAFVTVNAPLGALIPPETIPARFPDFTVVTGATDNTSVVAFSVQFNNLLGGGGLSNQIPWTPPFFVAMENDSPTVWAMIYSTALNVAYPFSTDASGTTAAAVQASSVAMNNSVAAENNLYMNTATGSNTVPCFLPGTLLLLADGTCAPIETLREGMHLMTGDGRAVPIQRVAPFAHPAAPRTWLPVELTVPACTADGVLTTARVQCSPGHALFNVASGAFIKPSAAVRKPADAAHAGVTNARFVKEALYRPLTYWNVALRDFSMDSLVVVDLVTGGRVPAESLDAGSPSEPGLERAAGWSGTHPLQRTWPALFGRAADTGSVAFLCSWAATRSSEPLAAEMGTASSSNISAAAAAVVA